MTFRQRVKTAVNVLTATQNNSLGSDISNKFLRYGNRKPLVQDWSQLLMTDQDQYTGYSYAAINNRANGVVRLATNNLKTDASDSVMAASKVAGTTVEHPYIDIIDTSPTFSNSAFWYMISTYLDLKGWFPILVVRNVQGNRYGNVQEFQMLNPYCVRRIINQETQQIGGYEETRMGDCATRLIDPTQIIDIHGLNPFNWNEPYAMTTAAKGSQFTLKQADDFTRQALKNNQAAPGIISTNVELEPQQFENFVSRIRNQEKGEPLWGNGAGAVAWDPMQIDMGKAGLTDINEISLTSLIAVTGNSKTQFGIEQSGVTRDTADVQGDLFISNHTIPQLQLIVDALNQDYKNNYKVDYTKNGYTLCIDSPLGIDKDAEKQDVTIKQLSYNLYTSLVDAGYDRVQAAKYSEGEITLEDLGEPVNEAKPDPIPPLAPVTPVEPPVPEENSLHSHDDVITAVNNQLDAASASNLSNQQNALQNTIANIDSEVVATVIKNISKVKNAFDSQNDIITDNQKQGFKDDLAVALAAFYGIVMPLYGSNVMSNRLKQFGMQANFKLNASTKAFIKANSTKAADSHVETIVNDMLTEVQEAALRGETQTQIINAIQNEYTSSISQARAKVIARTESNRAFSMSQYEADKQFVSQNNLQGQAYKQWITRSANPCPICLDLASQPPIPLETNFANMGDTLTGTSEVDGKTKVTSMQVDYEDVEAGTVHPNCSCTYQLIIQ